MWRLPGRMCIFTSVVRLTSTIPGHQAVSLRGQHSSGNGRTVHGGAASKGISDLNNRLIRMSRRETTVLRTMACKNIAVPAAEIVSGSGQRGRQNAIFVSIELWHLQ